MIENVVSNIYNGVSYDKQKEQLIYKPNNIRQINLLWKFNANGIVELS